MVVFVLSMVLGTTLASAQTVILRHALPGSSFELVLDQNPVGTAKADASGNATVTTSSVNGQMDGNVWLDTCGDDHRVILVKPGAALIPAGGCRRIQIAGLFLVQRETSMVIDANNTTSLLIRQGRAYAAWLTDPRPPVAGANTETVSSDPLPPMTGLTLFGAAGLGTSLNFQDQSCGALDCTRESPIQYGGGVGWWVNEFFGVEGRYGYLGKLTVAATESGFQFSTTREGGFLAFGGRAGFRKGRFRPFGHGGLSLGRATVTTTETVGDSTQTFAMRTRGWAPVYGAGVEIWFTPRIGLFADGQRLGLKGKDEGSSGIKVDDTLLTMQVGLTVRFPR